MTSTVIEISSDEEPSSSSVKSEKTKPSVLDDVQQRPKRSSLFDYFGPSTSKKRARILNEEILEKTESVETVSVSSNSLDITKVSLKSTEPGDNDTVATIDLPYYVKNFWLIIDAITVLAKSCFTSEDLKMVEKLRHCSLDCQKMFIRLFQRQKKWILRGKISYERELTPSESSRVNTTDQVLSQLVLKGLLVGASELSDIKHAVELLTAPQVKTFSTQCGLFPASTKAKCFTSKSALLEHLLKLKSSLSHHVWSSKEKKFINKCRELVGSCYSLPKHVKHVFLRIFLLFSLIGDLTMSQTSSKSGNNSLQSQLFSLLEVDRGVRKFPDVTGCAAQPVEGILDKVYASPDKLDLSLWFHLKSEKLTALLDAKKDNAIRVAGRVESKFNEKVFVSRQSELAELPKFLRSIALPAIAKRTLFVCSEVYERFKKYDNAVSVFKLILGSNKAFAPSVHGKVWQRLIIDLNRHLNKPDLALESALSALADSALSKAIRLTIEDRIESELAKRVHGRNVDVSTIFTRQVIIEQENTRTITAPQMSYQFDKYKTAFYRASMKAVVSNVGGSLVEETVDTAVATQTVADGYEICSVEQVAMDYYLNGNVNDEGCYYSEGLHAEGSSICTLMGLLFWDIIFSQPTGCQFPVFLTPYQSAPLDLYCGKDFYEMRSSAIENRLDFIENSSGHLISRVTDLLADVWKNYNGEQAHTVSWSTFTSVNQACRFVTALGASRLCKLMRTVISNFAFYHSGFPDLTLWDAQTGSVRFVEVKGPGDSLSPKQRLWLDLLRRENIPAEVCRVDGVKSKHLSFDRSFSK